MRIRARLFVRAVMAAVLGTGVALAPRQANADLTYGIDNYPAYQSGYTISGSITTDGTTGTITGNNIKSWTVTVSSGGTADFTLSSAAGNFLSIDTVLNATETSLSVNTIGGDIGFLTSGSSSSDQVIWTDGGGGPDALYFAGAGGSLLWLTNPFPSSDPVATVATTAVPEPSSLAIATLGAVAFIAYRWRRHGRGGTGRGPKGPAGATR